MSFPEFIMVSTREDSLFVVQRESCYWVVVPIEQEKRSVIVRK